MIAPDGGDGEAATGSAGGSGLGRRPVGRPSDRRRRGMDEHLIDEVAALPRRTGEAHHRADAETDGVDPEGAIWYAR